MIIKTIRYNVFRLSLCLSIGTLAGTLVACGSSDEVSGTASGNMPQSCEEYMAKIQDLMSDYPELNEMFANATQELENEWDNLSDAEKVEAEEACVSGLNDITELEASM